VGHEKITISAGGGSYDAFEECEVSAAFNEAARTFSFTVAAELGASATNAIFAIGTGITIHLSSDLVLTGQVDTREPSFAARKAEITVTGRSKSADLVDGSAEHETGQFENKDPLEIANEVSSEYGPKWGDRPAAGKDRAVPAEPGRELFPLR
jgi:prophage tail gpP-like protein